MLNGNVPILNKSTVIISSCLINFFVILLFKERHLKGPGIRYCLKMQRDI